MVSGRWMLEVRTGWFFSIFFYFIFFHPNDPSFEIKQTLQLFGTWRGRSAFYRSLFESVGCNRGMTRNFQFRAFNWKNEDKFLYYPVIRRFSQIIKNRKFNYITQMTLKSKKKFFKNSTQGSPIATH